MSHFEDLKPQLEDLVIKAQKGDKGAYGEFLSLLYPLIRSILKRRLAGLVDYEDLTQECLLGIHRNLASYHPSKPLKPWISAIIRYKTADHFRAMAKKISVTEMLPETNKVDEPSKGEVWEWLRQLPEPLRRAVELTQVEGLPYKEAAQREGVSEVALRKRISRAYVELRRIAAKEMEITLGPK